MTSRVTSCLLIYVSKKNGIRREPVVTPHSLFFPLKKKRFSFPSVFFTAVKSQIFQGPKIGALKSPLNIPSSLLYHICHRVPQFFLKNAFQTSPFITFPPSVPLSPHIRTPVVVPPWPELRLSSILILPANVASTLFYCCYFSAQNLCCLLW